MSLGNDYNNDKKSTIYDPTIYSPYRMNNAESTVDKTCMTFTYWKNTLRITIAPKKETGNDETSFDLENGISIYLSHTKARILADVMRKFLADPEKYDNSGVPSGQGIITISRGKEFNSPSPLMIIRKIDETGNVVSSFAYEFKSNYFFSVLNYTENADFGRDFESYNNLEIEQMITLLEQYYTAMTCATAYTVLDQGKFEAARNNRRINQIMDKLGISSDYNSGSRSGGRSYNSSSYFANGGKNQSDKTSGYTQATLDDIE